MKATITIKLTPESKGELTDTFGGQYREFRETFEKAVQEHGVFSVPTKNVTLRWLVDSGKWEEAA